MSDYKLQVAAQMPLLPKGSKVLDKDGREVGDIVGWEHREEGRIEVQAVITDPFLAQQILAGKNASVSISSNITVKEEDDAQD